MYPNPEVTSRWAARGRRVLLLSQQRIGSNRLAQSQTQCLYWQAQKGLYSLFSDVHVLIIEFSSNDVYKYYFQYCSRRRLLTQRAQLFPSQLAEGGFRTSANACSICC